MNNKTYAIIKIEDIKLIDFSQVAQSSASTVRKDLENKQFVIKWENGYTPTFITDGLVIPFQVLTHSECLKLMQTSDWNQPLEIKEEAKK